MEKPTKTNGPQKRLSLSFTKEAWSIMELVKDGEKSMFVSKLVEFFGPQFPIFLKKPSAPKKKIR